MVRLSEVVVGAGVMKEETVMNSMYPCIREAFVLRRGRTRRAVRRGGSRWIEGRAGTGIMLVRKFSSLRIGV